MATRDVMRLTDVGLITRFRYSLDQMIKQQWWRNIVFDVKSTQPNGEIHSWLGGVPGMSKTTGSPKSEDIRVNEYALKNVDWDTGLNIRKSAYKHNKGGSLVARIADLTTVASSHPGDLVQSLMLAGASTACYDGNNFFDTSHSEGVSGTQSNAFTRNATIPGLPTAEEFVDAMLYAISQMKSWKDDKGTSLNLSAMEFLVAVPVALYPSLIKALGQTLVGSTGVVQSNVMAQRDSPAFRITPFLAPDLTGNIMQIYRTDESNGRAFIWQVLDPAMPVELGLGSEYCIEHKRVYFGVEGTYNLGYGRWQHAAQVTFAN